MSTDITPMETDPAAEPDGGLGALTTSRGNLPLEERRRAGRHHRPVCQRRVTQGFRNPFDVPLEATYIFPLPDRAAVTAMRMEAAGHVVEAAAQGACPGPRGLRPGDRGRDSGRRSPRRTGRTCSRCASATSPPGERVTVRLTLAQPLPYEDGEATFRFPLVVAPRYIPGHPLDGEPAGGGVAADTDAVPDASRISPPVLLPGFPNPVRLTLSVEIDPAGLPLAGIRCSLHATAEEAADGRPHHRQAPAGRAARPRLHLAAGGRPPRPDRNVRWSSPPIRVKGPRRARSASRSCRQTAAGRPRPRDVVLVLDRSGSMHGWKMVAARRAAARIVDTLTDADRFAVLCFDNSVERAPDASPGLAWATDRNRFRAVEQLARTEARGGTEMLKPLVDARRLLTDAAAPGITGGQLTAARDRVLVLVTDGQVGNEDQILNTVGRSPGRVRMHMSSASTRRSTPGSWAGSPAPGGGRCELVESEDRLDRGRRQHPPPDRRPAGDRASTGRERPADRGRHCGPEPAAGPVPRRSGDDVQGGGAASRAELSPSAARRPTARRSRPRSPRPPAAPRRAPRTGRVPTCGTLRTATRACPAPTPPNWVAWSGRSRTSRCGTACSAGSPLSSRWIHA